MLIEAGLSFLLAPILMLYNSAFVVAILFGKTIEWGAQQRDAGATSWRQAIRIYGPHTIVGLLAAYLALRLSPMVFIWLLPFLLGPLLAIPLGVWFSDPVAGERLRRHGIFVIPEENDTPAVLRRKELFRQQLAADLRQLLRPDPLRRVVLDPAFHELHLGILRSHPPTAKINGAPNLENLRHVALHGGPERLTHKERLAMLCDEASLRWLHQQAWHRWSGPHAEGESKQTAAHG